MVTAEEIIKAAGGPSAVAEKLGVSPQAVSKWGRKNCVPANRVVHLLEMGKNQWAPSDVRPDVFFKAAA